MSAALYPLPSAGATAVSVHGTCRRAAQFFFRGGIFGTLQVFFVCLQGRVTGRNTKFFFGDSPTSFGRRAGFGCGAKCVALNKRRQLFRARAAHAQFHVDVLGAVFT